MSETEILLKVVLNLFRRLANVTAGDWEKGSLRVVCHTFRRTSLADARGSVKQYDQALTFSANKIDMMLIVALVASERGHVLRIMRLHERFHESGYTRRKDQSFEAVAVPF